MLSVEIIKRREPALILLHGIFADKRQLEKLWALPYTIIAPDLPGHGASGFREGSMFAQVKEELERILAKEHITRYILCGYSLGGYTTQYLIEAGMKPEAVILLSTAARLPNEDLIEKHDIIRRAEEQVTKYDEEFKKVVNWYRGKRGDNKTDASKGDPKASMAYLDELRGKNFVESDGRIDVPVLIVHARKDMILALSYGEEIMDAIPQAMFVEVGTDHNGLPEHPLTVRNVKNFLHIVT